MAVIMLAMLALPYLARAVTSDDLAAARTAACRRCATKGEELEEQAGAAGGLQRITSSSRTRSSSSRSPPSRPRSPRPSSRWPRKQAELDEKRREIEETDALFAERLRAMQVNRSSGLLSTLLAVNTFDELLTASTTPVPDLRGRHHPARAAGSRSGPRSSGRRRRSTNSWPSSRLRRTPLRAKNRSWRPISRRRMPASMRPRHSSSRTKRSRRN